MCCPVMEPRPLGASSEHKVNECEDTSAAFILQGWVEALVSHSDPSLPIVTRGQFQVQGFNFLFQAHLLSTQPGCYRDSTNTFCTSLLPGLCSNCFGRKSFPPPAAMSLAWARPPRLIRIPHLPFRVHCLHLSGSAYHRGVHVRASDWVSPNRCELPGQWTQHRLQS